MKDLFADFIVAVAEEVLLAPLPPSPPRTVQVYEGYRPSISCILIVAPWGFMSIHPVDDEEEDSGRKRIAVMTVIIEGVNICTVTVYLYNKQQFMGYISL